MKKYYLLLLFVTSFVSAQIVNIPDANFKIKLLSATTTNTVAFSNGVAVKIDLNNDNEIQLSEAIVIDSLNISQANIADVEGINNFLNLKKLVANANSIVNLDLSSLTFLKFLRCGENNIVIANLTANVSLETIYLNANPLTNVNVTGLTQLKILNVNENDLFSGTIDTSTLINLEFLDVDYTSIETLDLTQNSNLKVLSCRNTEIVNLDVSQNLLLSTLNCRDTQLTSLNLNQNLNLQSLICSETQIVSLDLSQNAMMDYLDCSFNINLEYLNVKNGVSDEIFMDGMLFNDNLLFVCADEDQIEFIQSILGQEVNVNSYCSFTPGGDYNTISGITRLDTNNNGCDLTDLNLPFLNFDVSLNSVDTNAQIFSNSTGNYNFFTGQNGVYTLTPNLENPTYFTISPNPATVNIPLIDNSITTQNFCITANGVHPDLEIVIVPIIPARPGFDAVYKIVYKNKGNQTVNGVVNFTYNDAVLDFLSASVIPTNSGIGFMNWTISNVAPFQVGTFLVTFNVNSPQEIPAVNIGDVLSFNATVSLPTDAMPTDNLFNFDQIVVGSYDPNDITCLQGNSLPMAQMGTYLHYNIRFENTGTGAAENIVVASEIDLSQYDIQSLQIMESSHPLEIRVTGNTVEFIHQGIFLDTGGHGNILLKLKSNNSLSQNLVINSADIFFDYNFPIETNDEQTVFADLSKDDFNKELSIQVYPNPTQDVLSIKSDSTINSIQLYDAQGRLLFTKLAGEGTSTIDLSSRASGIYFLKIITEEGVKTEKVIKK